MVVNIDPLDKSALVRILTEPKNSLVRQYQKLMSLDDVELVFTDDALEAAAERASRFQNRGQRLTDSDRGDGCLTSCSTSPHATTFRSALSTPRQFATISSRYSLVTPAR